MAVSGLSKVDSWLEERGLLGKLQPALCGACLFRRFICHPSCHPSWPLPDLLCATAGCWEAPARCWVSGLSCIILLVANTSLLCRTPQVAGSAGKVLVSGLSKVDSWLEERGLLGKLQPAEVPAAVQDEDGHLNEECQEVGKLQSCNCS
jgi:hypothetical protein